MPTTTSKKIIVILILLVLFGGALWYLLQKRSVEPPFEGTELKAPAGGEKTSPEATELNMQIESPVFANNQFISAKYTCDGENVNPPLKISGVPEKAKSLVLLVDDPDAPVGTWVHWTVWNIAPETTEFAEDSVPAGAIEGITDFGKNKYGGPCPPSGVHRYFFKVYALGITLDLDPSAKVGDIEDAMEGHILAQAQLIGLYKRQ